MDTDIDFSKITMADGWYCVKKSIVINRSNFCCPAPLGSKLFTRSDRELVTVDREREIFMIHYEAVIAWQDPEKKNHE